jgi:hypothetical protein
MANPDHLTIFKEGVDRWNAWRIHEGETQPNLQAVDLRNTDLTNVNLVGANLASANLSGANLSEANLHYANFNAANFQTACLRKANLRGASLQNAYLRDANLEFANLKGAILSTADLGGVNLQYADLRSAILNESNVNATDFSKSVFGRTVLGNLALGLAKGLDDATHESPSTLGIDTVYRSQGQIPELFLRGCGVPDNLIAYSKSLIGSPIQFYSCFISYSSKDQPFADRLYADLQAKGVRCWFAPHDIQGGRKIHEQIDEAIRLHDKVLLILSAHSMSSEWVMTEIAKARRREVRDRTRVLFPISLAPFTALRDWECFDADTGKDSAREIREYFIPDFGNWKDHDSYQRALERLIKDLSAGFHLNP